VHAPSQFLLDPPERCPHAIAPCCSFDKELPTAVAFTDEGKAKKFEVLRFSEPATSAFRASAALILALPNAAIRLRYGRPQCSWDCN
jgi:hypothetical protein